MMLATMVYIDAQPLRILPKTIAIYRSRSKTPDCFVKTHRLYRDAHCMPSFQSTISNSSRLQLYIRTSMKQVASVPDGIR